MAYLPDDPSKPEIWLIILLFIFISVTVVFLLLHLIFNKKFNIYLVYCGICLLAIPALFTISARNMGEWAQLKLLMRNYELQVDKYVKENGPIKTYSEKLKFYEQYPPPTYKFKESNEIIYVSYLEWISSKNKMGISWGNGANAAFDLNTMWCVYSD